MSEDTISYLGQQITIEQLANALVGTRMPGAAVVRLPDPIRDGRDACWITHWGLLRVVDEDVPGGCFVMVAGTWTDVSKVRDLGVKLLAAADEAERRKAERTGEVSW